MSETTWIAPTYATALRATGLALEPNGPALCPCGRRTNADMLTDVRAVPAETRAAWGLRGDFACDACRERAFITGAVTRRDFFAALGAPDATLERLA